jgi:hypothetical protein
VRTKIKSYDTFSHAENSLGEFYAKNQRDDVVVDVDRIENTTPPVKFEVKVELGLFGCSRTVKVEAKESSPVMHTTVSIKEEAVPIEEPSPDLMDLDIKSEPGVEPPVSEVENPPISVETESPIATIRGQLGASPYFQQPVNIKEEPVEEIVEDAVDEATGTCFKCNAIFPGIWSEHLMTWEYPGIVTASSTSEWLVRPSDEVIGNCDAVVYARDGLVFDSIECMVCKEV